MSDDGPLVQPWGEVRARRAEQNYGVRGEFPTLRDYIDDRVRNAVPPLPEVQLGYANLKRRG
jgi:hypothetical protein